MSLENSAILIDFKEGKTIVEQCKIPQYFQLQFSNVIYSENKCKIIITNEIFSNNLLNFSIRPVPNVNNIITKEINIVNKHLKDINDLKIEAKQLKGIFLQPIFHNVHISITLIILVVIIIFVVYIKCRTKIIRTVKGRHKKFSESNEGDILGKILNLVK